MAKQSILDVLKAADIPEMEQELQELEGKLELATQQFRTDIEALKASIKLANIAQHGKPERKKPEPRTKSTKWKGDTRNGESDEPVSRNVPLADRVATYLTAAGPSKVAAIQKGLDLSHPTAIYSVLNSDPRFAKLPSGEYRVSN